MTNQPSPSVSTDTGVPSRRVLCTLFGVPWKLTPKSWLFIPSRLGFCTVVARLFLQGESIAVRLLYGIVFAAINLLLGIGILLPFPGVDGEVVWRELRRK